LEVRSVLEAFAAEVAAKNRTDEDIAEIDRCLTEGRKASKANDLVTAAECHRDFHLAIERATGNVHIERTVAPLRHRTELVFSVLADSRGMLSWDEHQKIRDALAAGDPVAAQEATANHMRSVIAELPSTSGA
jgi:DNA-binding GntR family transcriptional regulator